MTLNLWLLLNLLSSVWCNMSETIYCEHLCKPDMSIPLTCNCTWAKDCWFFGDGMSWHDFRHSLLDAHNKFRNQFALVSTSLERKHEFKGVSNMLALSYDYDLEYVARCHTKRCITGDHHCVVTEKYDQGGRNTYTRTTVSRDPKIIGQDVLRSWYEIKMLRMKKKTLDDLKKRHSIFTNADTDFIQVIWASTEAIGCWASRGAITQYINVGKTSDTKPIPAKRMLITCAYGPGIVQGESVFRPGVGASQCPPGRKRNQKYKGLCGEAIMPPVPSDMRHTSDSYEEYDESNLPSTQDSPRFSAALMITLILWQFCGMLLVA